MVVCKVTVVGMAEVSLVFQLGLGDVLVLCDVVCVCVCVCDVVCVCARACVIHTSRYLQRCNLES